MAKSNSVRDSKRLFADSRDLIDQFTVLISGSGAACAVHKDPIEKTKETIASSRNQILRLRPK